MASNADDDLVASKTEGFKVGEKKTVEEYAKLGENQHVLIPVECLPSSVLLNPQCSDGSSYKDDDTVLGFGILENECYRVNDSLHLTRSYYCIELSYTIF